MTCCRSPSRYPELSRWLTGHRAKHRIEDDRKPTAMERLYIDRGTNNDPPSHLKITTKKQIIHASADPKPTENTEAPTNATISTRLTPDSSAATNAPLAHAEPPPQSAVLPHHARPPAPAPRAGRGRRRLHRGRPACTCAACSGIM